MKFVVAAIAGSAAMLAEGFLPKILALDRGGPGRKIIGKCSSMKS